MGVAIQLWCKEPVEHFLPEYLDRDVEAAEEDTGEVVVGGEDQDEPASEEQAVHTSSATSGDGTYGLGWPSNATVISPDMTLRRRILGTSYSPHSKISPTRRT